MEPDLAMPSVNLTFKQEGQPQNVGEVEMVLGSFDVYVQTLVEEANMLEARLSTALRPPFPQEVGPEQAAPAHSSALAQELQRLADIVVGVSLALQDVRGRVEL